MDPTGTKQLVCQEGRAHEPRAPAASLAVRAKALALTGALIVGTLVVGWMVWSVLEWRRGRTASYRLTGLRVVRSNGDPIGLGRSVLRNAVCCTLLLVPTLVACGFVAFAFVMGASPPNGLLRQPRRAPWDILTNTNVVYEHGEIPPDPRRMRLAKWHDQVPLSVN
jgi:RDD family